MDKQAKRRNPSLTYKQAKRLCNFHENRSSLFLLTERLSINSLEDQSDLYLCNCICVFVFVYLYLCICIFVFVVVYLCFCICFLYLCVCICVFVFVFVFSPKYFNDVRAYFQKCKDDYCQYC